MTHARTKFASAVAFVLLIAPASVRAERVMVGTPTAIVVIPGTGADVATARAIRLAFIRTFAQEKQVQLLDPLKLVRSLTVRSTIPDPDQLQRARGFVARRRYPAAEKSFRRILGRMKRNLTLTRRAMLAEVSMQLARATFELGKRRKAMRQLTDSFGLAAQAPDATRRFTALATRGG